MAKPSFANRLVVDLTHPKARSIFTLPLSDRLQSSLNPSEIRHPLPGWIYSVGSIPGDRVTFEWSADSEGNATGKVAVRHRLEADKARLKELQETSAQDQDRSTPAGNPREPIVVNLHNGSDVATWLWWLMRWCESKHATCIEGDVPSREAIRAIGDVRIGETLGAEPKPGYPPLTHLPRTTAKVPAA